MPFAFVRRLALASRSALGALGLLAVAACHTPTPNDLILLDIHGAERFALSTEDGIVALSADDVVGAVPALQYWRGREVRDELQVVQHAGDLSLLKPTSARFTRSTFAADDIAPGEEELFIQVIAEDFEHLPHVIEAHWYADGRYGDLLELDDWFIDEAYIARRFAGAGVYAMRQGVYEIVGILNGTLASNPDPSIGAQMFDSDVLFPFVRLDQIAAVLPRNSKFFDRGPRAFRPDLEHGLQPDGSEVERANPRVTPADK